MTRNPDIEARAIFNVPGLSPKNAALILNWEAGKLDGIIAVEINHILDTVYIRYDTRRLTLDALTKNIRKIVDNE